ncbi:DNA polymerase III subunit [uncultured Alistipes sp.]|uniref:DNA polymerase III subunit n=1 Tax=uncultured Alistipes sp. TaxID=538949 RepID=UPI00263856BD|nr:DNA polymerase III subunit [uncultured Alistipes sp.]
MQFKEIIGQKETIGHLVRGVDGGRIGHAQLFTGDEGFGALPLAVAYVQYINCTNRHDGDSCGVCPSCRQIAQLAHPDVHFVFPVNTPKGRSSSEKPLSDRFLPEWRKIFAETGGYFNEPMWYSAIDIDNKQGNISTFEADEIIRKLSFKSFESEYKAVVVWLPERMNVQAANKLLKILEEPWSKTLFLLVSASPDRLLATILSRTQSVAVPGIEAGALTAHLASSRGLSDADARQVARLSRGSVLEAGRILSHGSGDDAHFDLFVRLMRLSYEDRHMELLEWAETVASMGREEQKRLMENSIRLIRDSYMLTAGVEQVAFLFGREYDFCRKFAPYVHNGNVERIVSEMELVIRQIAQNGNPRIVFPHFALSVSKLINRL